MDYIYREFTLDFFKMDLNSLPKNAVVSDGAAPVLSRVAGGDLTGLFAGAVVFGSLVPLVCAVPSRGRLLPAACGFISIAAGAVLLQWTVQCLGLPAWQFFAR